MATTCHAEQLLLREPKDKGLVRAEGRVAKAGTTKEERGGGTTWRRVERQPGGCGSSKNQLRLQSEKRYGQGFSCERP